MKWALKKLDSYKAFLESMESAHLLKDQIDTNAKLKADLVYSGIVDVPLDKRAPLIKQALKTTGLAWDEKYASPNGGLDEAIHNIYETFKKRYARMVSIDRDIEFNNNIVIAKTMLCNSP